MLMEEYWNISRRMQWNCWRCCWLTSRKWTRKAGWEVSMLWPSSCSGSNFHGKVVNEATLFYLSFMWHGRHHIFLQCTQAKLLFWWKGLMCSLSFLLSPPSLPCPLPSLSCGCHLRSCQCGNDCESSILCYSSPMRQHGRNALSKSS